MRLVLALAIVAASATAAHAYPQYQVSREQTCVACHLSPDGGGLLNEYGEMTAEEDGQWTKDPRFLYGAVELPAGLYLGGDFRAAAGAHDRGVGLHGSAFPMQLELHGAYRTGAVLIYADAGVTVPEEGGSSLTALMSREHYVQWNQEETGDGWYARGGRFQPTYGLRLAEHVAYTRRFGGTPLFSETYGAQVGWISGEQEVHVTGFVRDRLRPNVADGDGAAIYAERRFGPRALGVQGRYANGPLSSRFEGGLTGKWFLDGPKIMLSAEGQILRERFDGDFRGRTALVGYAMATWFAARSVWVDLGVGHYDENVKVPRLDRDAVDVNVHWFADSHLELVLMGRVQMLHLGDGGPGSGYALLQAHFRL